MSSEVNINQPGEQSSRKVDPYRANRELERWLFDGVSQDQLRDLDYSGNSFGNRQRESAITDDRSELGFFAFTETIQDSNGEIEDIITIYRRSEELTEGERQKLASLGYTVLAATEQEEN